AGRLADLRDLARLLQGPEHLALVGAHLEGAYGERRLGGLAQHDVETPASLANARPVPNAAQTLEHHFFDRAVELDVLHARQISRQEPPLAALPGEDRQDDLPELLLHEAHELVLREDAHLAEDRARPAVAQKTPLDLLLVAQADHTAPEQEGRERLVGTVRGREDDHPVFDVQGLLVAVAGEVENARLAPPAVAQQQIGDRCLVQVALRRVLDLGPLGEVRIGLHLLNDSEDTERPEVLVDVEIGEEDAAADLADAHRTIERGEDQLLSGPEVEVLRDRAAVARQPVGRARMPDAAHDARPRGDAPDPVE